MLIIFKTYLFINCKILIGAKLDARYLSPDTIVCNIYGCFVFHRSQSFAAIMLRTSSDKHRESLEYTTRV